MTHEQETLWRVFRYGPAEIGRLCGYPDLTDELHGRWMRQIIFGEKDYTLQAHRLSYKSSALSVAMAIWMVINHDKNAILMRKTDADAAESLRQAAKVFENPVFKRMAEMLVGRPVRLTRSNASELTCSLYDSPRGAAQLVGMGIGGSLTGKHADLVVMDDAVNLSDRLSAAERAQTRAAVMEMRNIVTRKGRMIFIGTPWHPEDAFTLVAPPETFDCYQTGLITPEELRRLKAGMDPSLFAANYELRHVASRQTLFSARPPFTADASLLQGGAAHIDAAYGGDDFTAFTCACRRGDTLYLYGRLVRAHVDTVLDSLLADAARLGCAPVLCETNADKGYLCKEIRRRGHAARPYAEAMNKHHKIASYLRKWWPRVVLLEGTDPEYLTQILSYADGAPHDDAPDSASVLCRWIDRG